MRSERVWFATVAISALTSSILSAGGLSPPSAPRSTPGPEPRTPISAETTPGDSTAFFIITRPGSYYLTGNITKPLLDDPHDGIVITSSDVTIDLNGFTMDGFAPIIIPVGPSPEPQGLGPSTTGIRADGSLENITVRNGVVRDWNEDGVRLSSVSGALVEGVHAFSNGNAGIWVGVEGIVVDCVARENGAAGIRLSRGHASRCTVAGNGSTGLLADFGGTISECSAANNEGNGINAGSGSSVIARCSARRNMNNGIIGSVVVECSAFENGAAGILLGAGDSALNNTCTFNDVGIRVSLSGARVEGNTLHSNNRGIEASTVSTGGGLIVRNRATGSNQDHYGSIGSGHAVGTIQTSPVGAGPWDNFEF